MSDEFVIFYIKKFKRTLISKCLIFSTIKIRSNIKFTSNVDIIHKNIYINLPQVPINFYHYLYLETEEEKSLIVNSIEYPFKRYIKKFKVLRATAL